jgi:PAS domain S-box-containing protein
MSKQVSRAGEALTSGEQELRLLVEAIPALVWRAGPEGNIEYVNKRVLDYLGAPLDEVIGWGWMDKVHPDDVAFKVRTWLQKLESGNPHDAVCRIRGTHGRYRSFEVRGEPLRASDGRVLGWCGVLIDIDERRQAEEALRESEYKLRQIIETVPSLLWSLGPHGEQTQLNQRALDYIGVRYEDLLHLGWTNFLHPDDLSETAKAFYRAIQTGTSYQAVHRLRRADGEYRWHHARGEPLRDKQGQVIQWYGLTVDIDEGKRAEDRLRRSEAYLAEAQRLSHTGSFGWTPSTGELHWSDETFRILEYDSSVKPTIERVLQRVHPDDLAMLHQILDETSRGDRVDVTHRLLMPDGSIKFVHVLGHALKDAAGNPEIVGAVMDVTENTRLYRDLAEREAKIRRLVDANIIGVFVGDLNGRILEANDAFLRIVGYDCEDVAAGRINWKDLTPQDWRERGAQWIEEHERTGVRLPIEKEYFRKDGGRVPVLVGAANFEGGSQGVAFVIDLTERRRAEAALRDSEEALRRREKELRDLLETIPAMTVTVLPDGSDVFIGKRYVEYSGLSVDKARRSGWRATIHRDDLDRHVSKWRASLASGEPIEIETRFRRADGEYRWFLARAVPLRDDRGNILKWYEVLTDIEDRKRAEVALRDSEEALRRSEAYLAEAQGLSHTGSAAYNDTTILYWSDETYRIFGFDPRGGLSSREDAVERIHPDDRERALDEARRAMREKRDYKLEYRLLLPDRTVKHIESIAHPKFSASGELVEVFNTIIDVTETKRADEERKKAEERLRLSEARLAEAQRLSHSGVAAYDETTILYGSEETYRIWGFDPAQGVPSREAVNQRIHPDDRNRVLAEAQRAVAERRDYSIGFRIVLPDGTAKNLESIGRPRFSASGELVEIVVTHLDVTERKRAEQALRDSEYKLRQIIETVPGLIWSTGPDGEPTQLNQRLLDYSGMRFEDFLHLGWKEFLHPDDFPETAKAFYHSIQTGTSYQAVNRLRRADGEYRWYHTRGEPLRDREGRIIQWYGLSVDIDEGKKAEDRLRRSEAHLAEAQRLSRTGSSVYSETAILDWSEEAFRIWGFDPEQGLPTREAMLQRIHPDDRDRYHQETKDALREKRDYSIQFRIVLADGTVKDVEKIYHPVFSTSGELVEIIASGIDVTERKRAEEERERLRQLESDLAHTNRVSIMGELAASLAHEITQPIASARNNARAALNFLDQQPPNLGEVGEALGCVVGDADRAGRIVDRIRDHIKKAPPLKHRFDLSEAINEVILLARNAIAENGVSIQTRLSEGLAPIEGDRVQLQQVVLNLVLNAAEAMSAVEGARELLISAEQSQNGVLVAVRDSGPGIDPEHVERVFDAFYTTKSSGVGMGLSICRSIIEAHGGRLWADANDPMGAVFQFALPSAERSS